MSIQVHSLCHVKGALELCSAFAGLLHMESWCAARYRSLQIPKLVYYRTFYQLLFGPIESPLKTNAVFLKKINKQTHLSFSPTS